MNTLIILRQLLAYAGYSVAALFLLSLAAYYLRTPLRILYDHWRNVGLIGRIAILLFVTVFVLYGGSKQTPPSSTNEPPDSLQGGDFNDPTNPPPPPVGLSPNNPNNLTVTPVTPSLKAWCHARHKVTKSQGPGVTPVTKSQRPKVTPVTSSRSHAVRTGKNLFTESTTRQYQEMV